MVDVPLVCPYCGGKEFYAREILVNTVSYYRKPRSKTVGMDFKGSISNGCSHSDIKCTKCEWKGSIRKLKEKQE